MGGPQTMPMLPPDWPIRKGPMTQDERDYMNRQGSKPAPPSKDPVRTRPGMMAEGGMVDCPDCGHRFAHGGEVVDDMEPESDEEDTATAEKRKSFVAALKRRANR